MTTRKRGLRKYGNQSISNELRKDAPLLFEVLLSRSRSVSGRKEVRWKLELNRTGTILVATPSYFSKNNPKLLIYLNIDSSPAHVEFVVSRETWTHRIDSRMLDHYPESAMFHFNMIALRDKLVAQYALEKSEQKISRGVTATLRAAS